MSRAFEDATTIGVEFMKHMVDLCSGLGGASEAFVQSENWTVLRIDNNPLLCHLPCTVIQSLQLTRDRVNSRAGRIHWGPKIDFIWASPPCTDFSGGWMSPKSIASREIGLENYNPDLTLLKLCKEIIDIVNPKHWCIENVVGAIRYFEPILGPPRQIIGPYVLWGNFPIIDCDTDQIVPKKFKDTNSRDPLRSNRRAKVDFEISKSFKLALDAQLSITDFM